MNPTQKLRDLGQSLWLDNITRDLLNGGTLKRYIDDLSVTGLTSNPTIFDNAIKNNAMYDQDISHAAHSDGSGEDRSARRPHRRADRDRRMAPLGGRTKEWHERGASEASHAGRGFARALNS